MINSLRSELVKLRRPTAIIGYAGAAIGVTTLMTVVSLAIADNPPSSTGQVLQPCRTGRHDYATGDAIVALVGPDAVVAHAFGVVGLIPASDGNSMTITAAS